MLLLFIDIISIQSINSQNVTYPFKSFTDFRQTVDRLGNISDPAERAKGISELWDRLKGDNQVPFRLDDSVAFLYRGEATAVSWAGDFNGWKPGQPVYAGKRSGLSDIWMAVQKFPTDARLDYKIIVDDKWILDPDNPRHQMSGMGPKHEPATALTTQYPCDV